MILHRTAFIQLEKILQDSKKKIDYILINYKFEELDDKVTLNNEFMPIYAEENSKLNIETILENSLSLVVYDRALFEKKQKSDLTDTVLKVLERRHSEDTFIKIDTSIYDSDLNISDYKSISKNDGLKKIISDTLLSLSMTKKLMIDLVELDINFLHPNEKLAIFRKQEDFNRDEFNDLSREEQIKEAEKHIEEAEKYFQNKYKSELGKTHYASISVRAFLKSKGLTDLLYNFFFDEEDYLIHDKNNIDEEILVKAFYEGLSKSSYTELYKNTDKLHKEIIREIEYVNLYKMDDPYGCDLHLNSLYKLYKNITANALKDVAVSQSSDEFLLQKEDEYLMLFNELSKIEHEQSEIIDKELKDTFKGDIEAYEDNLYNTYGDAFYKADVHGVSIDDIKALNISKHQKAFKELYIFENYQLEMELIEKYINNNKPLNNDIDFESNIPTTKVVKGKKSRLTLKERKKLFTANKKKYKLDLQDTQENERLQEREDDKEIIEKYDYSHIQESNSKIKNITDYNLVVEKYVAQGFSRDDILAGKHSDEISEMFETDYEAIKTNQEINTAREALLKYRARVQEKYNPSTNNNVHNIDLDEEEIDF